MWEETARLNLFDLAPALGMPVFFFLGRNDHWVPPEAGLGLFAGPRAEEEGRLVRAIRTRAVRRRAGEVQRRHG